MIAAGTYTIPKRLADSLAANPLTLAEAERLARVARALIAGSFANRMIRKYLYDPLPDAAPWKLKGFVPTWTEDKVRENPTVRVEFEHAFALGGIGECMAACRNKPTFGQFIGVLPVERDDPVGEFNIVYVYKLTSKYNQRVVQRRWMKKRLGDGWRGLVKQATTSTKGDFLTRYATQDAAHVIRSKFAVEPGEFWRMAKGKLLVAIPDRVQPLLFADLTEDEEEDDEAGRIPLTVL